MALKERLKKALNNKTEAELLAAHQLEVRREEKIFSELYKNNQIKNGNVETHQSYNAIPKFYFALPKDNETIKVNFQII